MNVMKDEAYHIGHQQEDDAEDAQHQGSGQEVKEHVNGRVSESLFLNNGSVVSVNVSKATSECESENATGGMSVNGGERGQCKEGRVKLSEVNRKKESTQRVVHLKLSLRHMSTDSLSSLSLN